MNLWVLKPWVFLWNFWAQFQSSKSIGIKSVPTSKPFFTRSHYLFSWWVKKSNNNLKWTQLNICAINMTLESKLISMWNVEQPILWNKFVNWKQKNKREWKVSLFTFLNTLIFYMTTLKAFIVEVTLGATNSMLRLSFLLSKIYLTFAKRPNNKTSSKWLRKCLNCMHTIL